MTAAAPADLEIGLKSLLGRASTTDRQALEAFAVLNLGLIESLRSGTINAQDGVVRFYNAANCLFVRRKMKNSLCNEIMSRGVQLPDLFDALSPSAARRQFAAELKAMGALCLKLLRDIGRRRNNGMVRAGARRRAG